jgi:hypothetical protein
LIKGFLDALIVEGYKSVFKFFSSFGEGTGKNPQPVIWLWVWIPAFAQGRQIEVLYSTGTWFWSNPWHVILREQLSANLLLKPR